MVGPTQPDPSGTHDHQLPPPLHPGEAQQDATDVDDTRRRVLGIAAYQARWCLPPRIPAQYGPSGPPGTQPVPPTAFLAADTIATPYLPADANLQALNPASIANVGGSQAHLNMQPFLVLNFSIALQGIFPSPN